MRRARVEISLKGQDVTRDLCPYLTSFIYADKAHEELDDLQLVLSDRDRLWQGDWLPKRGDTIRAKIVTENWERAGDSAELDCGEFEIDELELESSCDGGDLVHIKAVPAAVQTSLMLQRKTRAWENCPMVNVVADIAGEAGLDVLWKAPGIVFQRVEQRNEADLAFLTRITKEQGLRMTIKSGQLIIYMGQTADMQEPLTVERNVSSLAQSLRMKKKTEGVYASCKIGYQDALNSDLIETEFADDDSPVDERVLTINKRIENPQQAERVAAAELRDKNSKEYTGSLSDMGKATWLAGIVLELKGWGDFDAKYVVTTATHSLTKDGGYKTSVELEKALEY